MKKQKKKPLAIVLVLCAVMVVAAIIMNAMLKDYEEKRLQPDNLVEPVAVDPYASGDEYPADTDETEAPAEPDEFADDEPETQPTAAPAEHGYQVFKEDISWTGAQKKCAELGGHLAVIDDEDELQEIIRLAEEAGITDAVYSDRIAAMLGDRPTELEENRQDLDAE